MSLLGIPFDPNHVLGRVLAAARNLVALTVFGSSKRFACLSVGLGEGLRAPLVDAVANVLDDHASFPSITLPVWRQSTAASLPMLRGLSEKLRKSRNRHGFDASTKIFTTSSADNVGEEDLGDARGLFQSGEVSGGIERD